MKAEYLENKGCLQRDSAEREEYEERGALTIGKPKADGAELLERILNRENLNRAYKRVKANKGAPGIDGMTVEDALGWLREHREELREHSQRQIQAAACAPKGNPKAGWRNTKVGNPNSRRPCHPAGNRTATNPYI